MKSKPVWKEVCAECNRIPREKIQARIVQLEVAAKKLKPFGTGDIAHHFGIRELKELLEVEG